MCVVVIIFPQVFLFFKWLIDGLQLFFPRSEGGKNHLEEIYTFFFPQEGQKHLKLNGVIALFKDS